MEAEGDVRLRTNAKRRPRPCSASYLAVRAALYQLTRLSDFRAEKIGGGFYADVFKVTHKTTGEVMVLKMNKNRKFSRQMLSEIQLMNRLSHTNILKFKGSCVHEGQLHALTEYINGGSLEDLLHNRSINLSWSSRVKIALDIAQGMAYLHSRGVFHRDLSSRNCLIQVSPDGSMKTVVADFGLAAKIKQSRRRSHTEVVGSPYWMAPECLNGKEYCEQADVFSYGIVLAEIMTRLPADPDFMPRTRMYGMDFEALHKMCPDCPPDLWELMVRCCQIDPDERPIFEEAVKILGQTSVVDEGEGEGTEEGEREEEGLRTCFSEPLLRLQDSDDNMSITSGQSSTHLPPPINSTDSLHSCSVSSISSSLGGLHLELEHKPVAVFQEPEDSRSDEVFEDTSSAETKPEKLPSDGDLTASPLVQLTEERTSVSQLESDDDGANKGDSGIDPGELFVAPVVSHSEVMVENLLMCGESNTNPREEELDGEGHSSAEEEHIEGDITPPCLSPSVVSTDLSNCFHWAQPHTKEDTDGECLQCPAATHSACRSPSNDPVPPITPCACCCSPQAPLSATDISLFLPDPSTPWAPPPSPIRSNSYQLSSSLPSSPVQKRKQFRFSMEVQEVLFPPFDPSSFFTSPANVGINSVKLRSTPKPKSVVGQSTQSKCKRCSLRHSIGLSTPLPTFPEDSETKNGLFDTAAWKTDSSVCVNLDRKFSQLASRFAHPSSPLHRARSSSNPAPIPLPSHYSLTLDRFSPGQPSESASMFKYYRIRPCHTPYHNCRLSSSEPNLSTCFDTHLL